MNNNNNNNNMSWLIDVAIWSIVWICSHVLTPFIKFSFWYLMYTLGAIAIKILCKLRYEVFNEDLKFKRAHCTNRVVLITGATSGIGLAVANFFYIRGFVVIACYYSKNEPGYEELNRLTHVMTSDLRARSMYLIELDVKSSESIENCYKQVRAIMANNPELQLHALLNVAGVGYFHKFQWISRDNIENMVKTNLLGPMLMTRQFFHLLTECPNSRVVNVASPMAFVPVKYNSVYGATKAGLTQFTNALEADTMRYGVKTVTIHPGNFIRNTSILHSSMEAKLEQIMTELNDEEKRLYGTELDEHLKGMNYLEKAFERPVRLNFSRNSTLKSNLIKFGLLLSGAVDETKLQLCDSFMQSFDNSIRLKDPPKEMFAGNILFNVVIGSGFEWVSRALLRDAFLVPNRKWPSLFNFI